MRQVTLNCFTYNTEVTSVIAHAQKIYHALWRHFKRWVLPPTVAGNGVKSFPQPPMNKCNEQHCLLTTRQIEHSPQSIRCGRCSGTFHLDALYELSSSTPPSSCSSSSSSPSSSSPRSSSFSDPPVKDLALYIYIIPYIIMPSKELLDNTLGHDEWICPLCLQDASNHPSLSSSSSPLFLDGWGCSAAMPWLLHPTHSTQAETLAATSPSITRLLDALVILSTSQKSSLTRLGGAITLSLTHDLQP